MIEYKKSARILRATIQESKNMIVKTIAFAMALFAVTAIAVPAAQAGQYPAVEYDFQPTRIEP